MCGSISFEIGKTLCVSHVQREHQSIQEESVSISRAIDNRWYNGGLFDNEEEGGHC